MNARRTVLLAIAACAATLAFGQPAHRLYRVGYFASGFAPADGAPPAAVRQAMRELGYAEGRDALMRLNEGRVLDHAAKSEMPTMYESGGFVRDGGLISYGPRPDDLMRRVAVYVDRILKGARPADLPVEQPNEFELVVNMKTAESLGVAIPASAYLRANEVIQ